MMEKPAGYTSLRRIGDLKSSFRPTDHDGWLLLDGRTVKKADYPKFFEALLIPAATAVLPDGKDAVILGAGGRLKVMETGGSNEVTLTVDNLPAHDHGYVDSYAEAQTAKGGALAGILTVFSGLAAKTGDKTTAKTGAAKPVKIEPKAFGANWFVYVGRAL